MARTADPGLHDHIVDAALRLLDNGGISALSMRAVAKAAGTTTPTLYDRFQDHEELLQAVVRSIYLEIAARIARCKSVEKLVHRYLRYISEYPHRYELLYTRRARSWETDEPKPIYELILKRMGQQIKGSKAQIESLALAILALAHGTSMLKIAAGPNARAAALLEKASIMAVSRVLKA